MALPEDYESYTTSYRRYLYRKERALKDLEDPASTVWRSRRLAATGTTLPSDLPARAKLLAADVLAVEEVTGASVPELRALGLGVTEAEALINYLEA